ncbi:MAG TPA: nucleotide pyrophosphohydrolase [Desulfocapsa sulfexigens]|nr:nucleotide pyrophosphohydrolase [Desulfocapsa sulfexigens]HIQ36795.1 nucleotide pyrophosphohydrolase [Desulfocapsa sulfexigens]
MEKLRTELRTFASVREWQSFHTPKNLAMALSVETAELTEIFQWMGGEESREVDDSTRQHISEEVGDVMIYLTMLADKFDLDPLHCAKEKMKLNEKKYPSPDMMPCGHIQKTEDRSQNS